MKLKISFNIDVLTIESGQRLHNFLINIQKTDHSDICTHH